MALMIAGCLAFATAAAAMPCAVLLPDGASPLIGMNYAHHRVGPSNPEVCGEQRPGLQHLKNAGIVDTYDHPGVREMVRAQLAEMRRGGISSLRIIIWHRTEVGDAAWGIISSQGGRLSDWHASNLQAYIEDVAAAGYRRLTVAMGQQGANSPKCRRRAAGDCFDATRTDENIRFTLDVRAVAGRAAKQGMQLRFDLFNEGCVDPDHQPVASLQHEYLLRALREYVAVFGDDDVTISCGNIPRRKDDQPLRRVGMLLQVFRDAGVEPRFLDFHVYSTETDAVKRMLDDLYAFLQPHGTTLTIGESLYHSVGQRQALSAFLSERRGFIDEIAMWPVVATTLCRITVSPPYEACALNEAVAGAP